MTGARSKWALDAIPKRVLIYMLSGYVLLQFAWWAYMLVDLNAEIYRSRLDVLAASGISGAELQIMKAELDDRLSKRIWMVLGEGAVFILILFFGFRAVQRSVVRELQLAAQQRNFLLSVTHELKSPIAAVRLQLQTLASREIPDEKRKQIHERALSETDRLQTLVENLLLVNKVEARKFPLHLEAVDLCNTVARLCNTHFPAEVESGRVHVHTDGSIQINVDRDALRSILVNLVENGLKYGGGSAVAVSVSKEGDMALLTVEDSGPGIPASDRERVFQRFYRLGNEDTRSAKGTGIGLYLVRQLADMQGGSVSITDNSPSGARFRVILPIHS